MHIVLSTTQRAQKQSVVGFLHEPQVHAPPVLVVVSLKTDVIRCERDLYKLLIENKHFTNSSEMYRNT